MVENIPVKSLKYNDLVIEGYSRAAVQTCWRIDQLRMGFDLGAQPWEFMGTPVWLISHAHLDHIAALPVYIARRRMMKMEPPTIYLPEHAIPPVNQMLAAFTRLDRGHLPCELIGVVPGDEIEHSRELVISVLKTYHTIPSVGYLVWDRRHKLKPQYLELSGQEIRDLKESGTEITNEVRIPLLAYMGDTTANGLDENPDVYEARILISEMTFVAADHRKELIRKSGHMHLDDYVQRKDEFRNELIIAGHLSTRYGKRQVNSLVRRRLPDMLGNRLHLWI